MRARILPAVNVPTPYNPVRPRPMSAQDQEWRRGENAELRLDREFLKVATYRIRSPGNHGAADGCRPRVD
jgi:hypothetical protein